jgi:hypothetical protein
MLATGQLELFTSPKIYYVAAMCVTIICNYALLSHTHIVSLMHTANVFLLLAAVLQV